MPSDKRIVPLHWKITLFCLGIGFVGLGACRLIADSFFGGEKEFLHTRYGSVIEFTFVFFWSTGLLALVPMSAGKDQKRIRVADLPKYRWWQWLLLIPLFSIPLGGNAYVPRWISFPIIAVVLLLAAWLFIVLAAMAIMQLRGMGPT